MTVQLTKPNRTFAILVMLLSVSASRAAIAQTKDSENCSDVPDNLSRISLALDVCHEVSRLTHTQGLTQEQLTSDLRMVDNAIAMGLDEVRLTQLAVSDQKRERVNFWLKISAYVLGGIGAGAGGSLRLANDKSVQHAGTVVSIAGGLAGAGVNLFDTVSFPRDERKTEVQLNVLPNRIRRAYIDPKFGTNDLCKHPSKLSTVLVEMAADTAALRSELKLQ